MRARGAHQRGGTLKVTPVHFNIPENFPSNYWNAATSSCFGWIPVKRGMTKSYVRAFGTDGHYNEKLCQHVIWKSIEVWRILEGIAEHSLDRTGDHSIEVEHSSALLSRDYRFGIGIVGKDDKKNISVAKWGPATKAVAQQAYTAIVPKDQDFFSQIMISQRLTQLCQLSMRILIHQNI